MSRHHGTTRRDVVSVDRLEASCDKLGPGNRSVIWVSGCELRCRGCIAPETHVRVGPEIPVPTLAEWIVENARDGLTVSGGEPLLQSAALGRVIDLARLERPELHVMVYSGYRQEWIARTGSKTQRELLARADLLIDGPYVERLHAPLRWRGSRNQRIIDLSGRTPGPDGPDEPAGVDIDLGPDLRPRVTGVWPLPGFRSWIDSLTEQADDR